MSLEVLQSSATCCRCGKTYSRRKGYFPVNYGSSYKGIGYLHICRSCIDEIYNQYLEVCKDQKKAVRQVCRKLDLYWNESIYELAVKKSATHTLMTTYMTRINTATYAGKSYDDTLMSEGTLWDSGRQASMTMCSSNEEHDNCNDVIDKDLLSFWGPGYHPSKYKELQDRYDYYLSRLPDSENLDLGAEVIIRQICILESEINADRAAGRPVDKSVTLLNTLIGSANLKPTQKAPVEVDSSLDNTPFGVWIDRFENKRPIPEVDPELADVDGVVKYITVWFLGHLCKMLGIRNSYCKLYEDEMAKRRIEKVEYDDEDDEDLFNDIFNSCPEESE